MFKDIKISGSFKHHSNPVIPSYRIKLSGPLFQKKSDNVVWYWVESKVYYFWCLDYDCSCNCYTVWHQFSSLFYKRKFILLKNKSKQNDILTSPQKLPLLYECCSLLKTLVPWTPLVCDSSMIIPNNTAACNKYLPLYTHFMFQARFFGSDELTKGKDVLCFVALN